VAQLVNLAEDLLELVSGEQVGLLAAAHWDEEEDIPHDDGQFFKQSAQVVEIVGVVAADGGVHLDGDARLVGPLDGLDGARPSSGQPAELVVNLRSGTVEGDAQPHQAGLLQLEHGFAREQRRGAGGDRDLHALAGGVTDQFVDVFALHRVAAGEDEDGHAHLGDLIDQLLALFMGQLVRVGNGLGRGATVLAGQVAGLGNLPDGQKGGFVKVQPATGGNVVHRLHTASSRIAAGGRLKPASAPGIRWLANS